MVKILFRYLHRQIHIRRQRIGLRIIFTAADRTFVRQIIFQLCTGCIVLKNSQEKIVKRSGLCCIYNLIHRRFVIAVGGTSFQFFQNNRILCNFFTYSHRIIACVLPKIFHIALQLCHLQITICHLDRQLQRLVASRLFFLLHLFHISCTTACFLQRIHSDNRCKTLF